MRPTTTLAEVASAVGRGLLAGAAGTAAMTVSSTLEAKLRERGSSTTPADAAETVLGVRPRGEQDEERFSNLVHWGYGTLWGAARGLIGLGSGTRGLRAGALHLLSVWGAEQVVLPATGASPPGWKWGAREVAVDLLHHTVYAAATGAAYDLLARGDRRRR
ncbi:hypothetical protein FZ103_08175 [Streptomonospora sp. PA3]|uniref:hypothetical protein n=1 Tax=Streptomonospora sp. PA3 TaxID=2607326 RepID=UPI0012DD923C|nr:hypothetical protein [Streptomonospora sp. PA3]MUL41156.1 hypothetical protein [Streptomonospora sp. PA3]